MQPLLCRNAPFILSSKYYYYTFFLIYGRPFVGLCADAEEEIEKYPFYCLKDLTVRGLGGEPPNPSSHLCIQTLILVIALSCYRSFNINDSDFTQQWYDLLISVLLAFSFLFSNLIVTINPFAPSY